MLLTIKSQLFKKYLINLLLLILINNFILFNLFIIIVIEFNFNVRLHFLTSFKVFLL